MKVVKKMIFLTLTGVYIGLINSCVVVSIPDGKEEVVVEHELICNGNLYGAGEENLTEQKIIISSQSELESLMDKMSSINPMKCSDLLMTIDLAQNDLIFILDRVRGSGGFSIEITDVSSNDDLVTIYYSILEPQGMAPSVMSQPYLFEKLPKLNSEVRFVLND